MTHTPGPDTGDGGADARGGPAFPAGYAVGDRVVVRYRLAEPDEQPGAEPEEQPGGRRHTLTDALGEITRVSGDAVVVMTRRGPIHVPLHRIVAAKRVPPPPAPRGRRSPAAPSP